MSRQKLRAPDAVKWKTRESKSYDSWSKVDNFVWNFLITKALQIVKSRSYKIHDKSLLEICCGPGVEAQFLAQKEKMFVIGLDLSKAMVRQAKGKDGILDVIRGDAEMLPLRNEAFNIGFVYNGLHHLLNPYRAISELTRVSKEIVLLIDIMNPLVTRLLNTVGLFKYEGHTHIQPNRLKDEELRKTMCILDIHYIMLHCLGYLPIFSRNNLLMRKIFLKINSWLWRKPFLGLVLGNMAIVVGYKQKWLFR